MTTSNEHNNAPPVLQGWKLVPLEPTPEIIEAICHAKNLTRNGLRAVMSDTELASIYRAMLAATTAPAPAQDEPFGYFRAEPFGWTDCAKDDEGAIALYERPQEVGLTDEGRQQVFIAAERRMVREPNLSWRDAIVDEVIAALRAKGQS